MSTCLNVYVLLLYLLHNLLASVSIKKTYFFFSFGPQFFPLSPLTLKMEDHYAVIKLADEHTSIYIHMSSEAAPFIQVFILEDSAL